MNPVERIKGLEHRELNELRVDPKNPRTKPRARQEIMRSSIESTDLRAGAVARRLPDESLQALDWHLRPTIKPWSRIAVLVIELSDDEIAAIKGPIDPLVGFVEGAKHFDDTPVAHSALLAMLTTFERAGLIEPGREYLFADLERIERVLADWIGPTLQIVDDREPAEAAATN